MSSDYLKSFRTHLAHSSDLNEPVPHNGLLYLSFPGQDLRDGPKHEMDMIAAMTPGAPRVSSERIAPGVVVLEFEDFNYCERAADFLHQQRCQYAEDIARHSPEADWLTSAEVEGQGVVTSVVGPVSLEQMTDYQRANCHYSGCKEIKERMAGRQARAGFYEAIADTSINRWADNWAHYIDANFKTDAPMSFAYEMASLASLEWGEGQVRDRLILNRLDLRLPVNMLNGRETGNVGEPSPMDLFSQEGVFQLGDPRFALKAYDRLAECYGPGGFSVAKAGMPNRVENFKGVIAEDDKPTFNLLKDTLREGVGAKDNVDKTAVGLLEIAMRQNFLSVLSGIQTLSVAERLREESRDMRAENPGAKSITEVVSGALSSARRDWRREPALDNDNTSMEPGL